MGSLVSRLLTLFILQPHLIIEESNYHQTAILILIYEVTSDRLSSYWRPGRSAPSSRTTTCCAARSRSAWSNTSCSASRPRADTYSTLSSFRQSSRRRDTSLGPVRIWLCRRWVGGCWGGVVCVCVCVVGGWVSGAWWTVDSEGNLQVNLSATQFCFDAHCHQLRDRYWNTHSIKLLDATSQ